MSNLRQGARVRPAVFSDGGAISLVRQRNGLEAVDVASWRDTWQRYPFAEEFRDIPIGWVLEAEQGEVVGTIGNIHMLYEMNGRRIRAALATAWAVDAAHRGKALHLTTAFFRQQGPDLLINGSASPTASKVLTGLRIPRIPIPDYGAPCFWAVRHRQFALAALRRRGIPGSRALSWPAGGTLFAGELFRGGGRGRIASSMRRLDSFDDRFDALWERISAGPPRLRAVRTRAVLDWKFAEELSAGGAALLTAESGGALSGYIVLVRRPGEDLGMRLFDVADFQAVGDDPAVYRDLLLASLRVARDEGVDAVKLMTGTPARRIPALALRPYTYRLPFWQLYYQASPELTAALGSADAWDFSLFDTY